MPGFALPAEPPRGAAAPGGDGAALSATDGAEDEAERAAEQAEKDMRVIWETSHVIGAMFMCLGQVMLRPKRQWEKFHTLASAGWLRGWGWSCCVAGGLILVASIVTLSRLPEQPLGHGIALLLAGMLFVALGPFLLGLGNRKLMVFMNTDLYAISRFPEGTWVAVQEDECPELRPIVGAEGKVIGHHKGRVAVELSDPAASAALRRSLFGDGDAAAHRELSGWGRARREGAPRGAAKRKDGYDISTADGFFLPSQLCKQAGGARGPGTWGAHPPPMHLV